MTLNEAEKIIKNNSFTLYRIQEPYREQFRQMFKDQDSISNDLSLLCWDIVELQQKIYLQEEPDLDDILSDIARIDNRVQAEEIFSDEEILWANNEILKLVGHIEHTKQAFNLTSENDLYFNRVIEDFKDIIHELNDQLYSFPEAQIKWNRLSEKEKSKLIIGWETGIDRNGPDKLVD
jgi:hypothetical protein